MKSLNQRASKVFSLLTEKLNHLGDAKKIDNADGVFMAVHVDFICENEHGKHFAVAHHYLQNGDVMNDPEMVFLLSRHDNKVYPMTFRQDGYPPIDQTAINANTAEDITFIKNLQRDITAFANTWMQNIKEQQGL
jgi:Domain of unknown function (DUF6908)